MTAREIAALFEDLELRLIASLKRNLARHKAEEKDEGFDWPAWQAEKLHSLQRFRRKADIVVALIARRKPVEDIQRLRRRRLLYLHLAETAFQCSILLDMGAEFLGGSGTDHLQLSACQHRL
mgnify:CR=1 FL=1